MNFRFLQVGLGIAAAALITVSLSASPADAQQKRKRTVVSANSPNYSYQAGPRTRIYVSRRNWLDLGTEVLPGERKYTDYAIPPNSGDTIGQLTGRSWSRQPLPDPWDLPGYPKGGFGSYGY
ncbi:hypothetical protein X566_09910 [Afipia sp. P52-10]|jgi:hypothetical protein|uniref:hypothetical protein n=1 Tax=Afipia sp. P52-10 TaxID=1429916 RepID=UPI0003DF0705|nr:hypothetical protein [Afipia sp. P52-10]ETR77937.1 hypothetical protein X566_09910 [Afipia sp. P52-10]